MIGHRTMKASRRLIGEPEIRLKICDPISVEYSGYYGLLVASITKERGELSKYFPKYSKIPPSKIHPQVVTFLIP